ncbi:TolC family protein [Palleronia sp. KMU-117]|uniref:TolC family protein n=1 Tax=Palleronia sp. KMU-117 TaxID=3434108 RepID=UPI003D7237B1
MYSLTVGDAILYVLETNPEISSASANKEAIEFELDQARSFRVPRFSLEAESAVSANSGTTTPALSSADEAISGYAFRARVGQTIFDGFSTRSEIERQAYRVDAAALRVLERSEFLSLEAVRVYAEVLRSRTLIDLAQQNLDYHREVLRRIEQAFDNGVVGVADLQQVEERVFLAEDAVAVFRLEAAEAEAFFLETVGVEAEGLGSIPRMSGSVPSELDAALAVARRTNPTIRFLQADVGSAEALSRKVDGNRYPTLDLEAYAVYGEDLDGFEGRVEDYGVGLVLRYEFQGNQNRALRQEHIRRVNEARADLLTQVRLVEREVRESWANREAAQRRVGLLERQVDLSLGVRASYEQEFEVGTRSLLDVLNTQISLFEAQINLANLRSLETYINYRLLAAMGVLLPTLGVEPPTDALTYAGQQAGAPAIGDAPSGDLIDARSFSDWRKSLGD